MIEKRKKTTTKTKKIDKSARQKTLKGRNKSDCEKQQIRK